MGTHILVLWDICVTHIPLLGLGSLSHSFLQQRLFQKRFCNTFFLILFILADIFNYNISDLAGITDTGRISMADMLHKTRIQISEEGGVASTVSSEIVDLRSRLGVAHLKLNVDRPFVFFIYNTRQDIPVFMGKIVDPSGCDGKLISLTSLGNDKKTKPEFKKINPEKSSRRIGNNMKRFNSLFGDKNPDGNSDYKIKTSTPVCPSGSLEACADGCRGNARAHSICIQYCEIKCVV